MTEEGYSLTEVLIALACTLVLIASAGTALIHSEKATTVNDVTAQAQQNARIAMELITHDLKMAGFGGMLAGPVGACTSGIMPLDNNPAGPDAGPDSIRMVVPLSSPSGTFWSLSAAGTGPFTTVSVSAADIAEMQTAGLAGYSIISIGGSRTESVRPPIDPASAALTLGTAAGVVTVPAPVNLPAGTPIFLLQCITYAISTDTVACGNGGTPCLMRNNVPIAEGIADLQLAYGCDGCNALVNGGVPDGMIDDQGALNSLFDAGDFVSNSTWGASPMTGDSIRLIRVTIVAEQSRTDTGLGEGKGTAMINSNAVTIEDHPLPASSARRRILTKTVQTRNIGLL